MHSEIVNSVELALDRGRGTVMNTSSIKGDEFRVQLREH
jgi:hypothetical protein